MFPLYIPKLKDSTFLNNGASYDAILMDADHCEWRKKLSPKARELTDLLIINPTTYLLQCDHAKKKESFQQIGYPTDIDFEEVYANQDYREENIIKPAIDIQIKHGANIAIAPYFYVVDSDDTKFSTNLTLISETIRYFQSQNLHMPLYAMIMVSSAVLTRHPILNFIIDRYKEFNDHIEGFFVVVDELNCKNASEDILAAFAYLAYNLSQERNVYVKRVGPFGEILAAIGVQGICSGLGEGESFSMQSLQEPPPGRKNRA
ncbi:MAG: hypothetical protein WC412_02155, partial [Candidatus Omnitrophota bacterium]